MNGNGKTALETAAGLLARRAHGMIELRRKLHSKGFCKREIDEALCECERMGFLDDKDFACKAAVEMKARGCGPRKVKAFLSGKGVSSEDSEDALKSDDVFDSPASEVDAAYEALKRRMKTLEREADTKRRKEKALRFLSGRGFSSSASYDAIARMFKDKK